MSAAPKSKAPQPPTTPRRKPFKRPEKGPLAQKREIFEGLAKFGNKLDKKNKKERNKRAFENAGNLNPFNKFKF